MAIVSEWWMRLRKPSYRCLLRTIDDHCRGSCRSSNGLTLGRSVNCVLFTGTFSNEHDLQRKNNWRTDPSIAGGGCFVDLASHGFDLMQYFFGNITEAHGFSRNIQGSYVAEDVVTAT